MITARKAQTAQVLAKLLEIRGALFDLRQAAPITLNTHAAEEVARAQAGVDAAFNRVYDDIREE